MKVLIVGLGSIGLKHVSILKQIKPKIIIYAYRSTKKVTETKGIINLFSFDELRKHDFYFILISTPSALHKRHILKLSELQVPMMIEKPLCISKKQVMELSSFSFDNLTYIACNMRFHPMIIFIKEMLKKNEYKVNEVNIYCGSYLPNWRKDREYSKIYSSIKKLGGGVHLDLIHEFDYLIFLFGFPQKILKKYRKVSNLKGDSIDYANIYCCYNSFSAQITLNYFRKDKKRILEIVTEKETFEIDFVNGKILELSTSKIIFQENAHDLMQDSYFKQFRYLLDCIEKKQTPMNNLNESISVLNHIL